MFSSLAEEEKYFPYINMQLEDARLLRYLMSNCWAFKDGNLLEMRLKNEENFIKANGIVSRNDGNLLFDSTINYANYCMVVVTDIIKIKEKDYYEIDTFKFLDDKIEIISEIENGGKYKRFIPYMEDDMSLK